MIKTGILANIIANDVDEKNVDEIYWKLVAFKNSVKDYGYEVTLNFNVNQYLDTTPLAPPESPS